MARSQLPVTIPPDQWQELRDAYGNLLARYHAPTNVLEFKARGGRMAYVCLDEYRLAFLFGVGL